MRRPFALFLVAFSLPLVSLHAPLWADDPAPKAAISTLPGISPEVHDALQSREFGKAIELIDVEVTKTGAPVDYLLYLKGRAQVDLNQLDEAAATFTVIEEQHPDSPWKSRARFGRADIFVRSRNYQAAGLIYKTEAERLLSRDRKDELAAIYLEFADRYFEGLPAKDPSAVRQPDFQQALTYYQEILKLGVTPKLHQRVEFRIALCLQNLQNHAEAIATFQRLLAEDQKASQKPEDRLSEAARAEARYQLGVSQLAAGQPAEARRTWQDFLSAPSDDAEVRKFRVLAASRIPQSFGFPQPPSVGDLELGLTAVEKFLKEFPNEELAPRIELDAVMALMHHARFDEAVARLAALIANPQYEKARELPSARQLLGQALRSQARFDEAIAAWKDFLERHPTDPKWSEVQQAIVDAEYAKADDQRDQGLYDEARKLWETFLNKYPLDPRAAQILFQFGAMKQAAAIEKADDAAKKNPGAPLADDVKSLLESAISDWNRVVQKYPGSNEASLAQLRIAVTLEERLGRLKEALEAYKRVEGAYQAEAQSRIAHLTEAQLEVRTERKFHSDEKPRVKIGVRNIEKVTLKIYKVDLADYFRKMHLATGVEALDVALIDPDETVDHVVDGYEAYRRIEKDVDVPVNGPGVWAVTVASDKLEATTMLVVSDLDLIVKASRNELFLFAENARERKAWEGVSILISDGGSVFAEESSGKDGVLQKSYEPLKSVADLRVFAVQDGHIASTVTSLNGLDFAVGLAAKGYLYTDRPAYRAGQLVNIKGIVRWVDGDRLTFKPGEKFTLDVYDSRGRTLQTQQVALNDFGTVASSLMLPATAPQGEYRIHLHQPQAAAGQSYESRFQVIEYRLEPVQLSIDVPQKVIYRGEKLTGTVKLEYYYGAPVTGKPVQYRIGQEGPWIEAVTDAKGMVAFEQTTQQFAESQALPITAQFAERNLVAGATVYVATRGFDISVSTLRGVFVNGESFDVTANVRDAAGDPVGTDLSLQVLELPRETGKPLKRAERGERLIATHEIKSDKEKGEARRTLRLDKGGRYIVRVSGTDRFGNRVSGQKDLFISGNEDSVRLRILADQYHYTVGDKAAVTLHWREEPALALITYEGAQILGYQLVELKNGVNKLEIPVDSKLAPNFTLAAAVMHDHKFHAADSPFRVAQKLTITLKPSQLVLKPGENATVEIEAVDPQGRPVSVELSLSLVQSNLLARFGDMNGVIDAFFGAGERTTSVRQSTSCTFNYAPSTQGINRFLLADAERRLVESLEDAAMPELAKELAGGVAISGPAPMGSGGAMGGAGFGVMGGGMGGMPGGDREEARRRGAMPRSFNGPPGSQADADTPFAGDFNGNGLWESQSADAKADKMARFKRKSESFGRDAYDNGIEAKRSSVEFESLASLIVADGSAPATWYRWVDHSTELNVTLNGQTADGRFFAINNFGEAELKQLVEQEGLKILPALSDSETAFWDPRIVTDEQGRARVVVTMPERSTGWKLSARGINAESLAGQSEVSLTTRKDLFGEIKLPLAFTAGDKAQVLVEVHNALEGAREITATIRTTLGQKVVELTKAVKVEGPGISEVVFPVDLTGAGGDVSEARFELSVRSADQSDQVVRTVAIVPYGIPVYGSASGSASQSTIAFVSFPEGIAGTRSSMEIVLGPSVNRSLIEAVLGSDPVLLYRCGLPPVSGVERATSDVLGGVAVLKLIGGSRDSGTPDSLALAGRISSAISMLVSSQRDDGGWTWTGRSDGNPDRFLSSRVLWALSEARRAGFAVPNDAVEKAVAYLNTALAQSSPTDRETQAVLLHGLASAGRADFALANRLHRERNALTASGLLHVAQSLVLLDRKEMVNELLPLIAEKLPVTARQVETLPWMQDPTELKAFQLHTLAELNPSDPQLPKLVENLLAARVGSRWPVEKANGPIIQALALWYSKIQPSTEKYTVTVFVNDRQIQKLVFSADQSQTQRISVPADALVDGKPQRINLDLEGRGTLTYSAVLTGSVPADQVKSTTDDWVIERYYQPALRMFDGQPIPRGWGVVTGGYSPFMNPVTQLGFADRAEVELRLWRRHPLRNADDKYPYLVISEPIPAGCQVLQDSIQGNFERYEIGRGEITFFYGEQYGGNINYTLVGDLPGEYRIGPTAVRNFYDPSKFAAVAPTNLTVLARGEKTVDEYRLTPDEFFAFGQRKLAKGDFAGAHADFSALMASGARLRDDIFRETVQSLFRTSVVVGRHGDIVKFFEIIKEKFPDVEIGFEDILTVAASYRELGEYERSYLVYRATIESGFQRETRTSGFLEARGELLRSVQVLETLLRDYPAEGYIASATYALAQEVYRHAPEAAQDAKLKEAGLTRVHLISQAIHMLDHFLSTWPNDPAADQASFALANALLDLEQYEAAITRSEKFEKRFPQSRLIDSFWYTIGLSRFLLGQPEQALEMCRKVADAKFAVPETGGTRDADNKWEAIYIMAQVFHSLGKAADAIVEYTRVKDRFADAAEAILFFTRKSISIPEVTTIRPADDKQVTLKFRNLPEASIKVYRIDLLKFGLLQRSFDRITAINLAGIRPYHEENVKFGDGKDYRDREQVLTLPLKEEGAYLVVCRGENLYASGLVLVSPLAVEVQEDDVSGRVRVTVKDAGAGTYASKVHAKVIGSANDEFVNGETDLRGLFIADGIRGTSTVIAMADTGQYAFYRGTTALGPKEAEQAPPQAAEPAQQAPNADGVDLLRQNMHNQNYLFQQQNRGSYEKLLNNSTEGVKAEKAY